MKCLRQRGIGSARYCERHRSEPMETRSASRAAFDKRTEVVLAKHTPSIA